MQTYQKGLLATAGAVVAALLVAGVILAASSWSKTVNGVNLYAYVGAYLGAPGHWWGYTEASASQTMDSIMVRTVGKELCSGTWYTEWDEDDIAYDVAVNGRGGSDYINSGCSGLHVGRSEGWGDWINSNPYIDEWSGWLDDSVEL